MASALRRANAAAMQAAAQRDKSDLFATSERETWFHSNLFFKK